MYTLVITSNPYKEGKIEVERQMHLQMSVEQLFGCKEKKMVIGTRSLKGIYYYPLEDLFYIFIDNYYLNGKYEVINQNLNILTECMMSKPIEKQVRFIDDAPHIERIGIKYVKQIQLDEAYLTMNNFETHQLKVGNYDNDEGNEQIYGQLISGRQIPDKLAYRCPNYLLKIGDIIFCFEITVSGKPEMKVRFQLIYLHLLPLRSTIMYQTMSCKLTIVNRFCMNLTSFLERPISLSIRLANGFAC